MQPRGATSREDLSELRALFDENPAKPEDKGETHGARSEFEWDDTSDEDPSPQSRNSHLRSLQRVTRRWQAQAQAQTGGRNEEGMAKAFKGIAGSGLSFDSWIQSARKFAEDRGSEVSASSAAPKLEVMNGELQSGSPTDRGSRAIKRTSVLKLFDDPVWSNGNSEFIQIAALKLATGCEQLGIAHLAVDSTLR